VDQKRFEELKRELQESLPEAAERWEDSFGDPVLVARREGIHDVLAFFKTRGFDLMLDLAVVDGLELGWRERFQAVYILYSVGKDTRIRVKVSVPEEEPVLPTATDLWKAANWAEREAWDMFGIRFEGHPNLQRILCHHEFQGHALRKDYPVMKGQWCSGTRDLREDLERE